MNRPLFPSPNPPTKTPPPNLRLYPSGRLRMKSRPSLRMSQPLPPSPSQPSRPPSPSQPPWPPSLSQLLRPPSPSQPSRPRTSSQSFRPLSLRLCLPSRLRTTIKSSPQMSRLLPSPSQSSRTTSRVLSLRLKPHRQRRYRPRKHHPASLCLPRLLRTTTRPPKPLSRHRQRKKPRLGRFLKLRQLPSQLLKPSRWLRPRR